MRLAPWNRFKPSSIIFYWTFKGGTSFVDHLWFFVSCVSHAFASVHCDHLLVKGWTLGSCWWCLLYLFTFPCCILGQVRYTCTWLYRFLIFVVFFFTFPTYCNVSSQRNNQVHTLCRFTSKCCFLLFNTFAVRLGVIWCSSISLIPITTLYMYPAELSEKNTYKSVHVHVVC